MTKKGHMDKGLIKVQLSLREWIDRFMDCKCRFYTTVSRITDFDNSCSILRQHQRLLNKSKLWENLTLHSFNSSSEIHQLMHHHCITNTHMAKIPKTVAESQDQHRSLQMCSWIDEPVPPHCHPHQRHALWPSLLHLSKHTLNREWPGCATVIHTHHSPETIGSLSRACWQTGSPSTTFLVDTHTVNVLL